MPENIELSKDQVLKIARLARLELSEDEIALYQKRLGRVLGYVKELEELKTDQDAVVRHVPKDAVAQREDRPIEFPDPDLLMGNAPSKEDGHFLMPAVKES